MKITDLIGKRVLLKLQNNRWGTGGMHRDEVQEYKILEVAPSEKWVRLQNTYGNKFWKAVVEVLLIEELKSFEQPPLSLEEGLERLKKSVEP